MTGCADVDRAVGEWRQSDGRAIGGSKLVAIAVRKSATQTRREGESWSLEGTRDDTSDRGRTRTTLPVAELHHRGSACTAATSWSRLRLGKVRPRQDMKVKVGHWRVLETMRVTEGEPGLRCRWPSCIVAVQSVRQPQVGRDCGSGKCDSDEP